jgi:hypothetical protein
VPECAAETGGIAIPESSADLTDVQRLIPEQVAGTLCLHPRQQNGKGQTSVVQAPLQRTRADLQIPGRGTQCGSLARGQARLYDLLNATHFYRFHKMFSLKPDLSGW